jgi:hypothetical protein
VSVAAIAAILLVGCTSDGSPDGGSGHDTTDVSLDPAVVADSSLTDPAQYATNGSVPEEPGFVQVDANTATTEQLMGAFQTNGIADAAEWAAQVIAHRPYAGGDQFGSEFDGLRVSLAEAGLDDLAVEAIVASLSVTR